MATSTLLSAFAVSDNPAAKDLILPDQNARLRLDVLSVTPEDGTVKATLTELVNPKRVLSVESSTGFEVGSLVRNNQATAEGVIVAVDGTKDAETLTLARVSGRFLKGETVRTHGQMAEASSTIQRSGFANYDTGDSLADTKAVSADTAVAIGRAGNTKLPAPKNARLNVTLGNTVTSASFLVRLET